MRIRLFWTDRAVEHIALHGVDLKEVEEICRHPEALVRRSLRKTERSRYYVYGRTNAGRYLRVVIERIERGLFFPVTAFAMTAAEVRAYKTLTRR